ncbi:PP2C family protein-serine/threonine phosphatase [Streptomyces sp. NRRL F-5123]|uniref:PP2C family protein-serine/threonine phosphatase n=1 Tax=Streptomyces sp. NRRL F-5123 TaxID=1463856 RepID=UPI00099B5B9E|nr:PP2C family protein-serine/threonine phosphatase [Streptomyces sp. NRRL F-5123]
MPLNGASDGTHLPRVAYSTTARLAAALLLLGLLLVVDVAGGERIRIGGLMVGVPALSAVFLGPWAVLLLVAATFPCLAIAAWNNGQLDAVNFPVVMATTTLIGGASVLAAAVRQRRERELAQARWVAAVTQRALLRPLPSRLGPLAIASTYLAADREAAIGGDLYAAADLGGGRIRVMVGDVQGKGMAAVEVTGMLLAAFRRSARHRTPLRALPADLDESLRDDLTDLTDSAELPLEPLPPPPSAHEPEPAAAPVTAGFLERFVTAVVVDVAPGGGSISIVNCGHPPPILLHRGEVLPLESAHPAVPLGLGDLTPETQQLDTYDLAVGDVLLLYTDGVIEARDDDGAFYPLTERLVHWSGLAPADLLTALTADLARHVGSRLGDDVAVVALQRRA